MKDCQLFDCVIIFTLEKGVCNEKNTDFYKSLFISALFVASVVDNYKRLKKILTNTDSIL